MPEQKRIIETVKGDREGWNHRGHSSHRLSMMSGSLTADPSRRNPSKRPTQPRPRPYYCGLPSICSGNYGQSCSGVIWRRLICRRRSIGSLLRTQRRVGAAWNPA